MLRLRVCVFVVHDSKLNIFWIVCQTKHLKMSPQFVAIYNSNFYTIFWNNGQTYHQINNNPNQDHSSYSQTP